MNETVLITGASSGIGMEFAKIFAREGNNLVLVARNEGKLLSIKNELETAYGVQVDVFVKDLSEKDSAYDIFDFTVEQKIEIDILVNNAGFGDFGAFQNCDWQKQYDMVQVNMLALMQLTRFFLKPMVKNKKGKILNIASTAAFQPGPMMSVYYASKAFVLSFTESLSVELKNSGISLMAFCPGPTKTGFEDKAELQESGLFKHLKNATPKEVAEYGYQQLLKGKVVVIHGWTNKSLAFLAKIMPRKLVRNFIYHIQK